jgi:AraC-like DNA-binding protein
VVRHLGPADSGLTHIARSVRWIREHYAQAFRVEDVAQLSGMSVSAFYRNVQAVTAMSPIQFQKHPSQFSREYRRRFGAPPSQDAARLRGVKTTPPVRAWQTSR